MMNDSIIPSSDIEKKIKSFIKKLGKKKKLTIIERMKNDLIEYLNIEIA